MDFKENLDNLRLDIDKEIKSFLDKTIKKTAIQDEFVANALAEVQKNVLSGGKRIRPALMCWGYWGSGGDGRKEIIQASIGIELIHAFLLIHDDIMDRDLMRHGKPTINAVYEKFSKNKLHQKDSKHFGDSIALIVGDMVGALGNQVIFDSQFDPRLIMKALSKLQDIVSLTVVGQSKDIYMEYSGKASERDVLEMYEYKTARYTLEGPLHLGGILGGANENILKNFSAFAIPLGKAFQIQDDILGIFGTEKVIGKTIGSDIMEGKKTILVVKALEMGNGNEKKRIKELLGKKDLTKGEIEEFKDILVRSGSLDYAKNLARDLVEKGRMEIKEAQVNEESKEFFEGLAEYLIKRDY